MKLMPKIWSHMSSYSPRALLRHSSIAWVLDKAGFSASNALEVGAGRGDLASYCLNNSIVSKVTVCEASPQARRHLNDRFFSQKSVVDIKEDCRSLPDGSHDCLILCEILEHVRDDQGFLVECLRKLSNGSFVLVTVPAYQRKWQKQDEWAGHVRRYEFEGFNKLLVDSGIRVLEFRDFGFPFMNMIWPLKQLYYSNTNRHMSVSDEEKTLNSGVDRSRSISLLTKCTLPILLVASMIQNCFSKKRWGDGFVVVGRYEKG